MDSFSVDFSFLSDRGLRPEPAPLILAFVLELERMIEESFRQSPVISDGDMAMLFMRPISRYALIFTFVFAFYRFLQSMLEKGIPWTVRKDFSPNEKRRI
jgi:TctA family transporter